MLRQQGQLDPTFTGVRGIQWAFTTYSWGKGAKGESSVWENAHRMQWEQVSHIHIVLTLAGLLVYF